MIRRGFTGLLLGLAVLLPFGDAAIAAGHSAPVLERIADSGKIRVGMSAGQPPFNVRNREGKIIGMDVDLARLMAAALRVELEIVPMPFSELLPALERGKVDLVMSGMTATLQRNMRAAFVGPYHVTGKSILARSETIAALQSEELNQADMVYVALKGSTSEQFVKTVAPNARLTATDDYDQAIDLLLSKKADAFVADAAIIVLSMMRWPDAGLVAAGEPLTVEPIGIAVPAGDPLMLNLVQNYLGALRSTGALDKLRRKWFENSSWLAQLP